MYEEGLRALLPCFTSTDYEFHGKYWDFPRLQCSTKTAPITPSAFVGRVF